MFYIFLQLIILFMESIHILVWTEISICTLLICFYSTVNFSVNGVDLYDILNWTDYLDLKVADKTIDL